ncbi:MAG: BatD family protein [Bacteroidetes bacterium]|nr:BatD family protein [Bacteroidota bacterium]
MRKRILLAFCLSFLTVNFALAQDVQFTGSARSVVGVGETFNLTYSVNAQASGFVGPSITGFDVLSGPFSSTSSSIRTINGRTSMSIACTFTYILRANREGSFEIPAATVTADNKQYRSNTVPIKVVKNGGSGQSAAPGSGQGSNGSQNSGGIQSGSNDVYLKAYASNANPMQGEGIIVTYKIFTKVPINQININKLSSFEGFWSQNLIKENDKFNQYTQVIDGEKYVVADIRKIALFPLKSGRLVIDPLELECIAQIKRQTKSKTGDPFFDDFFNNSFFNESYANVEKSLKSNPLVITVKPLPTAEKPVDFSGAVGSFTFKTELDKTKTRTNDAINLKCTISGKGNIQLIDKLNISFPPDFETYDPKINNNVTTTGAGVSGNQTFEYLIIPRKAGKFTIKPITFSYFDLEKRRYITLSSPTYTIDVEKGSGDNATVTYSGAGKEDIKYIGSDIRHIKNQPLLLREAGTFFFGSFFFFVMLLLPVVLFVVFILFWKKQEERRSDTLLMKNRKATRVAIKRLKKANAFLKEQKQEEFYIEISQALWGYLSDKFSIPMAGLSIDSVHEALVNKGVTDEIIRQFVETLNNTEFARFAPGEKAMIMEKTYQEALEIITRIERELK